MPKMPKMTIWKYQLKPQVTQLKVAKNAQVLSVMEQDGNVVLYMQIDVNAFGEQRNFYTLFTGDNLPQGVTLKFIGTVKLGCIVVHVYEEVC